MGGTDDETNIVELTIEEHAEAHRRLWEEYGNEYDRIAWLGLSSKIGREEILFSVFSEAGKRGSTTCRENGSQKGERNSQYGRPRSDSTKDKISSTNKLKGIVPPSQKGTIWINDGVHIKKIKKEEFDYWSSLGYNKGRIMDP